MSRSLKIGTKAMFLIRRALGKHKSKLIRIRKIDWKNKKSLNKIMQIENEFKIFLAETYF